MWFRPTGPVTLRTLQSFTTVLRWEEPAAAPVGVARQSEQGRRPPGASPSRGGRASSTSCPAGAGRSIGPSALSRRGGKKTPAESGASVVLASTINTRPPRIKSSVWHSPTFKSLAPPPVPGRGRIGGPEPPPNTHACGRLRPKRPGQSSSHVLHLQGSVQRRVPDWNLVGIRTKKRARFKPPGQDRDVKTPKTDPAGGMRIRKR